MALSLEQANALDAITKHDFSQRPFYLGGYAGAGKTYLLNELRKRIGNILFLAPTGKACAVLADKIPNADIRTIHSALYSAMEVTEDMLDEYRERGKKGDTFAQTMYEYYTRKNALLVRFSLNPSPELFTRLVVVDESSMIGKTEFENLVSVAPRIVFVGDPAQLPPVESASILPDKFDAFLKSVQRQALESPITRLSMAIRNSEFRGWEPWKNEGIRVLAKGSKAECLEADQVIAGMNVTRNKLNKLLREEKINHFPVVGDKIIVKQNFRRKSGLVLVNGDIGHVIELSERIGRLNFEYKQVPYPFFFLSDEIVAPLYGKKPYVATKKDYPVKFDYAYCITVHASQGSEWKKVVFFDDKMWENRASDRRRLLYTAITRAKEQLTIVTGK